MKRPRDTSLKEQLLRKANRTYQEAVDKLSDPVTPNVDLVLQLIKTDPQFARMKAAQVEEFAVNVLQMNTNPQVAHTADGGDQDLDDIDVDILNPALPSVGRDLNRIVTATYSRKSDTAEKDKRRQSDGGPNSRRLKKLDVDIMKPKERYADLAGMGDTVEQLREIIEAPFRHPEIFEHLRLRPPKGVLLHGPPGTGKTTLARSIAGELGIPLLNVSAPSVVSGMSGESEKRIRDIFNLAVENAPCLLFFDEIDVIAGKREGSSKEMERRMVAQMLTCLDELETRNSESGKLVVVVGATNRIDVIDSALRRAGRFDREVTVKIPDEPARRDILTSLTKDMALADDFDVDHIAKITPGFVGADLHSLVLSAGCCCIKRTLGSAGGQHSFSEFFRRYPDQLSSSQLEGMKIAHIDFIQGREIVQPSALREGFATVPDVSWDDIGALGGIRDVLDFYVVQPIRNPALFASVGISKPSGVLLYGPPGCGKTLIAKAVAADSHCNFISVKGPELLNKYVGESEKGVRQLFARARASAPCVIFFDEIDALCPSRGGASDNSSSERVVNQLLTEMDGLQARKSVFLIAATNRLDVIDKAVMRPGRFDKCVFVGLPDSNERAEIFRALCKRISTAGDVDLDAIASDERCENLSGADISGVIREAGIDAIRCSFQGMDTRTEGGICISAENFDNALNKVERSVSDQDLKRYKDMKR